MPTSRHINPDRYLDTPSGRVFTPERNDAAWQQAYVDLESVSRTAGPGAELFVVMGVQGAGKSSWVQRNMQLLGEHAVFFDAALPCRVHRERIIAHALRNHVPVCAVWINTPLELALARNTARPPDERVPEAAILSVFGMLEPPTLQEGFVRVTEVAPQ